MSVPFLQDIEVAVPDQAAHLVVTDGTNSASYYFGAGTPEGAVSANPGSIYLRRDGGAGTTLYIKESGTGNTGWSEIQTSLRKEAQDAVAFSATPTIDFDADTADNKSMAALTADITPTLTFTRAGWYTLELLQDGTGGRTVTWPASMEWTGAEPQPNATANAKTVFQIYYNGSEPRIVSHG